MVSVPEDESQIAFNFSKPVSVADGSLNLIVPLVVKSVSVPSVTLRGLGAEYGVQQDTSPDVDSRLLAGNRRYVPVKTDCVPVLPDTIGLVHDVTITTGINVSTYASVALTGSSSLATGAVIEIFYIDGHVVSDYVVSFDASVPGIEGWDVPTIRISRQGEVDFDYGDLPDQIFIRAPLSVDTAQKWADNVVLDSGDSKHKYTLFVDTELDADSGLTFALITGREVIATPTLPPTSSDSFLQAGALAGIIIGCVLFVGVFVVLGFAFAKKRKRAESSFSRESSLGQEDPGDDESSRLI
jgi:hypothetical protein